MFGGLEGVTKRGKFKAMFRKQQQHDKADETLLNYQSEDLALKNVNARRSNVRYR